MRSLIDAWGLREGGFPLMWVHWSLWCLHRKSPPVSWDPSLTARNSESRTLFFTNTSSSPWHLPQIEGGGHWKVSQITRTQHTHTWTLKLRHTFPFEFWDHKFLLLLLTLDSSVGVLTTTLYSSQKPSASHKSRQCLRRVIGWTRSRSTGHGTGFSCTQPRKID